jgi:hypothetical protein
LRRTRYGVGFFLAEIIVWNILISNLMS